MAQVHFYKKQHEQVVELLSTVEYEDFTYNLNSKAMLIATYYETNEIDPLYSMLESFRTYLNRHDEIPEIRRENFHNLIRFTRRLTKVDTSIPEELDKLEDEIKATKQVASQSWLLEKVQELR